MTITVHHLENSRSQRVLWLLEELGLPYEVQALRAEQDNDARASGAAPDPSAGEVSGHRGSRRRWQDAGDCRDGRHHRIPRRQRREAGSARQPGCEDALRYRQFLHYAEGSLMPVLFVKLVLSRVPLLGRVALRKFQPMVDVHLNYVESELAGRPWFAGQSFTAADVMMSFPLEAGRSRAGISRDSHPHIFKWVDTIHARAGVPGGPCQGRPVFVRLTGLATSRSARRQNHTARPGPRVPRHPISRRDRHTSLPSSAAHRPVFAVAGAACTG